MQLTMNQPITVTYSKTDHIDIKLDIHVPNHLSSNLCPGIIFFHGGGIVTGNRECLRLQQWLLELCAREGYLFLSADYRLLYPSSGFSMISDVKNLFTFLASRSSSRSFLSAHLPSNVTLDTTRLVAVGESGGGYPALAAALYAEPKPRGLLMQYCMGGQMLLDHYVAEKPAGAKSPYLDFSDHAKFEDMLRRKEEVSDDPVPYMCFRKGKGGPRGGLLDLWWREGTFVDHVLGEARVSEVVRREKELCERAKLVPERLRGGLLQLEVERRGREDKMEGFPSTMLVHGEADTMVLPVESESLHHTILEGGGKSELILVPGVGHGLVDEEDFKQQKDPLETGRVAREALAKAEDWLIEILRQEKTAEGQMDLAE